MQVCSANFMLLQKLNEIIHVKIIWHTQQPVTNVSRQHYHSRLDFYPPLLGVKIDYLLSAE